MNRYTKAKELNDTRILAAAIGKALSEPEFLAEVEAARPKVAA